MGLNIRALSVFSSAFEAEGRIPDRFANDKGNDQPEIQVKGIPEGTGELAVICHDPDAPMPFGFTHWTLYGIPPDTQVIPENGESRFQVGQNDFGNPGYGGPQPPKEHGLHDYNFWVYALNTRVKGLPSRKEFLETYGDHVMEQNRLVGIYEN